MMRIFHQLYISTAEYCFDTEVRHKRKRTTRIRLNRTNWFILFFSIYNLYIKRNIYLFFQIDLSPSI